MRPPRDKSQRLKHFARAMRSEPTDAEQQLWHRLRQKQLDGFRFRRQYPIAGYIVDFHCVEARLAIELDGGQHAEPSEIAYDLWRDETLRSLGVRILRFSNIDLLRSTDAVLEAILTALESEPPPQPSPGVPEEGE